MGPEKSAFKRAIFAGFVATAILTVLMFVAPVVGLPKIDIASALGTPFARGFSGHWWRGVVVGEPFGGPAAPFTAAWFLGLFVFLLFGSVVSPFVFVYTFPGLLGASWLRGIEWGIFVWVFGGVAVMTAMGLGFDQEHFTRPFATVLSSLAAHVVYGAILGAVAGSVLLRIRLNGSTNNL
jgi:amino acid transporter